jgi:hypothetical protein
MDQKMVCFGALRGTRSRQDKSIEVCEVGSKRPSWGGHWGAFRLVGWADLRLVAALPTSPMASFSTAALMLAANICEARVWRGFKTDPHSEHM